MPVVVPVSIVPVSIVPVVVPVSIVPVSMRVQEFLSSPQKCQCTSCGVGTPVEKVSKSEEG